MNNKGVCRTALATMGLLMCILKKIAMEFFYEIVFNEQVFVMKKTFFLSYFNVNIYYAFSMSVYFLRENHILCVCFSIEWVLLCLDLLQMSFYFSLWYLLMCCFNPGMLWWIVLQSRQIQLCRPGVISYHMVPKV